MSFVIKPYSCLYDTMTFSYVCAYFNNLCGLQWCQCRWFLLTAYSAPQRPACHTRALLPNHLSVVYVGLWSAIFYTEVCQRQWHIFIQICHLTSSDPPNLYSQPMTSCLAFIHVPSSAFGLAMLLHPACSFYQATIGIWWCLVTPTIAQHEASALFLAARTQDKWTNHNHWSPPLLHFMLSLCSLLIGQSHDSCPKCISMLRSPLTF